MIYLEQLQTMDESLRFYDVAQNGWEGDPEGSEPKSVEQNLIHVGFHLSDVIERKDFLDPATVEQEIAPDALQYALRFARWGDLALASVMPSPFESEATQTFSVLHLPTTGPTRLPFARFVRANGILARQLHEEDHRKSSEEARLARPKSLRIVAALLISCAESQAIRGNFDIQDAFANRLSRLRERFNITQPEA